MTKTFRTLSLAIGAAAMALSAIPAQAQFRGLFNDAERGARAAEGCEDDSSGDIARGVIGGLLGGAARRTANRAGLGRFVPVARFTNELSKEIACKLNEQEQEQAATATLEATSIVTQPATKTKDGSTANSAPNAAQRAGEGPDGVQVGPPIGQTASWTSSTREDVRGTSTVTAREPGSGDSDCITVTDVIIVQGEETRAEKRMCRLAGSPRYSIVA